ncbi:hypothetical protein DFJ74DRAFT_296148 [Hyaloraphidium curvatum]|nr:hypothetical protein DFJ74DRAFT_296148 [Hyaloraphidium curvatum]
MGATASAGAAVAGAFDPPDTASPTRGGPNSRRALRPCEHALARGSARHGAGTVFWRARSGPSIRIRRRRVPTPTGWPPLDRTKPASARVSDTKDPGRERAEEVDEAALSEPVSVQRVAFESRSALPRARKPRAATGFGAPDRLPLPDRGRL